MDGTLRSRRLPAVVLLFLCTAPTCAAAQEFVCWPIVAGDTAAGLARRLTGHSAAAYTHTFQIRDPARQMFVPKSHYQRLSTDWQACVATGPVKGTPLAYAPVVALAASPIPASEPALTPAPRPIRSTRPAAAPSDGSQDEVLFVAKIASAVMLLLLTCAAIAVSIEPRPIPPVMQRAGDQFIIAFARPLIDSSSRASPIEVRLRFSRRAQQLEISIAPGPGRRYPNLIDHKKNVEYDVKRVMRILGHHFFVSDRLRAVGKWVVVPIRLADVKQTGAK
jgi:hypothetical protein